MALKNVSFREKWVGVEVASIKTAFFTVLTQRGPSFWPPYGQNMEFLKQNFNFPSLRKTSKIVTFCYF